MAGKKILVVDDEEQIVHILVQALSRHGFEVITAADGRQGLVKVRNEHPDLVILDLRMPEMDGWRACHKIKKDSDTAKTPVIILSGLMSDVDEVTHQELGDTYVSKPFELDALVQKVRQLLNEPKGEEK